MAQAKNLKHVVSLEQAFFVALNKFDKFNCTIAITKKI